MPVKVEHKVDKISAASITSQRNQSVDQLIDTTSHDESQQQTASEANAEAGANTYAEASPEVSDEVNPEVNAGVNVEAGAATDGALVSLQVHFVAFFYRVTCLTSAGVVYVRRNSLNQKFLLARSPRLSQYVPFQMSPCVSLLADSHVSLTHYRKQRMPTMMSLNWTY